MCDLTLVYPVFLIPKDQQCVNKNINSRISNKICGTIAGFKFVIKKIHNGKTNQLI